MVDERAIARLLERFPQIAAAYLFGSAARGELRADSDLDVGLVLRDRRATAADCHRMLMDLAGRLEAVSEGRPVDLVVLDAQGPILRHEVLVDGRCVYEADRERRIDFESETHSLYIDFRPTYDIAAAGYLDGVRAWLARR